MFDLLEGRLVAGCSRRHIERKLSFQCYAWIMFTHCQGQPGRPTSIKLPRPDWFAAALIGWMQPSLGLGVGAAVCFAALLRPLSHTYEIRTASMNMFLSPLRSLRPQVATSRYAECTAPLLRRQHKVGCLNRQVPRGCHRTSRLPKLTVGLFTDAAYIKFFTTSARIGTQTLRH